MTKLNTRERLACTGPWFFACWRPDAWCDLLAVAGGETFMLYAIKKKKMLTRDALAWPELISCKKLHGIIPVFRIEAFVVLTDPVLSTNFHNGYNDNTQEYCLILWTMPHTLYCSLAFRFSWSEPHHIHSCIRFMHIFVFARVEQGTIVWYTPEFISEWECYFHSSVKRFMPGCATKRIDPFKMCPSCWQVPQLRAIRTPSIVSNGGLMVSGNYAQTSKVLCCQPNKIMAYRISLFTSDWFRFVIITFIMTWRYKLNVTWRYKPKPVTEMWVTLLFY